MIKNNAIKDKKKQGIEQVNKMLRGILSESSHTREDKTHAKYNAHVFGKKYKNYVPNNIVCVFDKTMKIKLNREKKMSTLCSIMTSTENYKRDIINGIVNVTQCKHERYTTEFKQLRSADESSHRLLTCTDCGRIFNISS